MKTNLKLTLILLLVFLGLPIVVFGIVTTDILPLEGDLLVRVLYLIIAGPILFSSAYMAATGKGSFLIAGYNTSSAAEKSRYKEKELTQAVGVLTFIFTLLVILALESFALWHNSNLLGGLIIVSAIILLAGMIYINISPRFLQDATAVLPADVVRSRKKSYVAIVVLAVIVVSAVLVSGMFNFTIDATLHDDHLRVEGPMFDVRVDYDRIDSVEMIDSLDFGHRFGYSDGSIKSGTFTNDIYGNYDLAVYYNVPKFIVVHQGDKVLVFNQQSEAESISFYNDLLNRLP